MTVHQELSGSVLTDLLFEEPGIGRCLVAPDGSVLRANSEWLRSTGLSLDLGLLITAGEVRGGRRAHHDGADRALRENEDRYRTLFASMTEGFALGEPLDFSRPRVQSDEER